MNLLKSLAAVSSITMISRVLGFVRDTIVARMFGAGMATDAFFIAFKLPNLLRRIFAEGAFSQAFVPILAEYKNQQGEEAARTFVAYVAGLLTLVLAIVTLLGMLAAPWVIWATAPGFTSTPEKFELTSSMLRVTFPYILLISLSSLAGAILNTWNRFSVPAFVPTLLNVSMIIFALFLTPYFDPPVMALGWAVLAGGLAQLLFQLPHLKKIGMLVLPRLNLRDTGVWRVMKQMVPAILGVSVSQISLIINTIFASFLVAGSVSWMYYADRLMELPSGVLGVALGTILLPTLSKTYANKDRQEYSRILDWGLRLCFLLVLPCSLALAILAEPLTVSLFQYGEFSALDAAMTQRALIAYSVGLLGLILIKVLAPGFYAQQNIRTPVKIAVFTLVVTQLLNLVFIVPLQHAGLALAISVGAMGVWVEQMVALHEAGVELVLVSSGAVAAGMSRLGWTVRPSAMHELQAAAAIGQMGLVQAWESSFAEHSRHTAQILLTHDDLSDRKRYLNARSTLRALVELGVIPVINENDTVVTDEIRFGDNDTLAALVANLVEADLLVILTDRDGMFDADPRNNPDAKIIYEARADDPALDAVAGGTGGALGRGGMQTKLRAARLAARSGAHTVIVGGRLERVLDRLKAGERLGTLLSPERGMLAARKQWLAGHLQTRGTLVLDDGAVVALSEGHKSLLPVGVKAVQGGFRRGEMVVCVAPDGREIARGLANYSAAEAQKIIGQPSDAIVGVLGYMAEPELVHRDNLILV